MEERVETSGDIAAYLEALKRYGPIKDRVVTHRKIPGTKASFTPLHPPLAPPLRRMLEKIGIRDLYSHQAEAINRIRQKKHTVVATPTASGKSLTYNIPVLERFIANPDAKALYLFPLKALARDQKESFAAMALNMGVLSPPSVAVYDGDTSSYERSKIRRNPPAVVISNPEMLHLALLPFHEKWAVFFSGLETVVIDEVHTLRGVMGSHMAWVFRRLLRICRHYGSSPTFVFCSATIDSPEDLAARLTGLSVGAVSGSGAASPDKHFLMLDGMDAGSRMVLDLIHAALHRGFRTLVYCQSRKMTELVALWANGLSGTFRGKIAAYRAGFLPEDRRDIEKKMGSGELLAVVSTSALEMGIDIGDLDLCILVGYPGTVMATWQRAGRVGRRDREAAILLIGGEDALDRFMLGHPDIFFSMPPEKAIVHPANPVIAGRHLACAAAELPLNLDDPLVLEFSGLMDRILKEGIVLEEACGRRLLSPLKYPHRGVNLRGGGQPLDIVDLASGHTIGGSDAVRAMREAHPGAVYIHNGEHYLVETLDLDRARVGVRREKVHYFTRSRGFKETRILEIFETRRVLGTRVGLCRLEVTDQITGYEKRHIKGQRFLGVTPLDLPPQLFETEGIWIEIPERVEQELIEKQMHFMGGIHALEHAAIGMLPLVVMCDRNDLGGISQPFHPQIQRGCVFIYDGVAGGIGLCREAFLKAENLLERTLNLVKNCLCESGCPACVHSPKCGSGNRPIDKAAAAFLLELLLSPSKEVLPDLPELALMPEVREPSPAFGGRYLVLDLETRRSAAEVGGWHRADRMEVSCVVVYDSFVDDCITFLAEDVDELIFLLKEADLVVGFNILRFDYRVLSGYTDFDFSSLPTMDLLVKVHERLGYRLSLDHLGRETLGAQKSADGLLALQWWKEGRLKEIIDYCRQDVLLTRDLYLYGVTKGFLLFRNKAGHGVRLPVDFLSA
ncbi:DEAD/DEAH box helicase [Desulfobotulus mexicanus]|uniref:DEAD/DEAH box helicase n=1 Tax=Desulfobotulus mexicanus TaxID=2586642 RepID=UPI001FE49411|nr:DEAD/DEAH box helicase [Desulfobotulus mexicanus]